MAARLSAQRDAASCEARESAAAAEAALASLRQAAGEAAAARREEVKRQQAEGGGKLQRYREARAKEAACDYEGRARAEAAAKEAKEAEIMRLVRRGMGGARLNVLVARGQGAARLRCAFPLTRTGRARARPAGRHRGRPDRAPEGQAG